MATLQELQARRANYLAAEAQILSGAQEYEISEGGTRRRLTRADLAVIRTAIEQLDRDVAALTPGARRQYRIVPGLR
jgi:hypothetical protein